MDSRGSRKRDAAAVDGMRAGGASSSSGERGRSATRRSSSGSSGGRGRSATRRSSSGSSSSSAGSKSNSSRRGRRSGARRHRSSSQRIRDDEAGYDELFPYWASSVPDWFPTLSALARAVAQGSAAFAGLSIEIRPPHDSEADSVPSDDLAALTAAFQHNPADKTATITPAGIGIGYWSWRGGLLALSACQGVRRLVIHLDGYGEMTEPVLTILRNAHSAVREFGIWGEASSVVTVLEAVPDMFPHLTVLEVSSAPWNSTDHLERGVAAIARIRNLRVIALAALSEETPGAFAKLATAFAALPHLVSVWVRDGHIDVDDMRAFLAVFHQRRHTRPLRILRLASLTLTPDACRVLLTTGMCVLRRLWGFALYYIDMPPDVQADLLPAVLLKLPRLRYLGLTGSTIDAAVVACAIAEARHLREALTTRRPVPGLVSAVQRIAAQWPQRQECEDFEPRPVHADALTLVHRILPCWLMLRHLRLSRWHITSPLMHGVTALLPRLTHLRTLAMPLHLDQAVATSERVALLRDAVASLVHLDQFHCWTLQHSDEVHALLHLLRKPGCLLRDLRITATADVPEMTQLPRVLALMPLRSVRLHCVEREDPSVSEDVDDPDLVWPPKHMFLWPGNVDKCAPIVMCGFRATDVDAATPPGRVYRVPASVPWSVPASSVPPLLDLCATLVLRDWHADPIAAAATSLPREVRPTELRRRLLVCRGCGAWRSHAHVERVAVLVSVAYPMVCAVEQHVCSRCSGTYLGLEETPLPLVVPDLPQPPCCELTV